MKKIETTFSSLLNMLAQVEKTVVKAKPSSWSFKRKKNIKQDKKDEGTTSKVLKPNGGVKKDKEDVKGTCHHCRKSRHWRHNCKEYIESVKGRKMKGVSSLSTKSYDDLFFPLFGI